MIGVATDQTPHYFDISKSYRETHPSSTVGSPGRMQGFNTGVTLYDLGKMRSSQVYQVQTSFIWLSLVYFSGQGATEVEEMIRLEEKYKISGTVGDQVVCLTDVSCEVI